MSESEKNLKAAFAGESQANRKYLAFAKKADADGFPGVARLFRAAAAAETVHAHNHLGVLGGIKATLENLKEAFGGEHYEFTNMYPDFVAKAKEENQGKALQSFHWANEVEKVHGGLYQEAIKSVEGGKDIAVNDWYICERCGYTIAGAPPDKCPVCSAKKELFSKVD
ncbi:MAG: rubrerythrin family protein [Deltaproteobacteria bacterium]|nr:rubrerythrin family protein [Deltaproteobacteria bacterium]